MDTPLQFMVGEDIVLVARDKFTYLCPSGYVWSYRHSFVESLLDLGRWDLLIVILTKFFYESTAEAFLRIRKFLPENCAQCFSAAPLKCDSHKRVACVSLVIVQRRSVDRVHRIQLVGPLDCQIQRVRERSVDKETIPEAKTVYESVSDCDPHEEISEV